VCEIILDDSLHQEAKRRRSKVEVTKSISVSASSHEEAEVKKMK